MTIPDPITTNRAHWDALAAVHGNGADRYYDVDALLAGETALTHAESTAVQRAVGELRGRDVLHVQCHIGFDTITLARAGAHVTGVDLSPASLAKAADFATRCGVKIEFVEGDAMALPAALHGRFDLAYATYGVIGWISDLHAWMRSVRACLRPGGSLVLVELHPLVCAIKSVDPLELWADYGSTQPEVNDDDGSYAQPEESVSSRLKVMYQHTLGEVVTAAAQAGLAIDGLIEHEEQDFELVNEAVRTDDGRWRWRVGEHTLPVLFTLRAHRPAAD